MLNVSEIVLSPMCHPPNPIAETRTPVRPSTRYGISNRSMSSSDRCCSSDMTISAARRNKHANGWHAVMPDPCHQRCVFVLTCDEQSRKHSALDQEEAGTLFAEGAPMDTNTDARESVGLTLVAI